MNPEPAMTVMSPPVAPRVAPSGPVGLLLRALIAIVLIAGWVQLAHTPVHRPLEDLFWAMESGRVDSITMERPLPGAQGQFAVEWDGPGRPAYSSYEYNTDQAGVMGDDPAVGDSDKPNHLAGTDQRTRLIDLAERSGVEVVEREVDLSGGGFRWQLAGIASLAGLLLLIGGPQPRLATKWAWFWLAIATPVSWLAFVVLEPAPWGRRGSLPPVGRRLTGGWAFLGALVLAGLLAAIPWYRDLFVTP